MGAKAPTMFVGQWSKSYCETVLHAALVRYMLVAMCA